VRRRAFLYGSVAVLAAPVAAGAQATRLPTVGVLAPGFPETPATGRRSLEGFERGLKEAGWIPGSTMRVEYRYAEGSDLRLDALARDLVSLSVDVIVARSSRAVQAAKKATNTIPIVMSASGLDPVELGLVAGLARPGGNVTGLTLQNQELYVKHLELLHGIVPRLSRVVVLGNPSVRVPPKGLQALEAAAKVLGVQLEHVQVRRAEDLEPAFAGMARNTADGLLVLGDPFVLEVNYKRVVALVEKHRLPAIYWLHIYPEVGGLMSYGADLFEVHRQAAAYVTRLLRGARPGDLPVEEPTKFSLVINLKTARALGLTIPGSLLARADQVIDP
jgi:putative tryptophan/tyrosine transport system substrate-binding protein